MGLLNLKVAVIAMKSPNKREQPKQTNSKNNLRLSRRDKTMVKRIKRKKRKVVKREVPTMMKRKMWMVRG